MPIYKKSLIVLSVLATVGAGSAVYNAYLTEDTAATKATVSVEKNIAPEKEPTKITVYVTGAVNNPGVVTLADGARAADAAEACGGFLPTADLEKVNLAEILKDGKQITVPTKEKEAAPPDAPKPATKPQSAKTSKVNAKININTADEAELEKLPGVGPVTAKKIVEYRNNNGKFADIEDIKKVRGIGEGRFAKMKDMIET